MAQKQINDYGLDPTPADDSSLITQTAGGTTIRTKVANLLARLFRHQPVWEDLMGEYITRTSGSNPPALSVFRDGIELFEFDAVKEREMWIMFHFHHGIKPNEDMFFHIHWAHNDAGATGTEEVVWGIEYTMARGYSTEAFPTTTTLSNSFALGTQYHHHISGDDATFTIPAGTWGTQFEPDTMVLARVFRDPTDGADNYSGGVHFLTCDIHYQIDKVGTTERNRPFTL